ncbi:hypothetical protein GYMLUDRAFT_87502 [Collybiopsis luxurians FD-317 M1]|uniref:Inositol polyphosphate-related phosphatase domain-containing protein n=1 Tax=Collybiopsis luxurians FD-317 M1 TaxID=944289 RepID=A0A0D0AYQ3_9AGAR|nr:hypothetical protein GYMLUDRAFT_87502 [Collybiopsis luxurians FD-317 M1]
MMDTPDIESRPTPAVKNLLSKFESLAVERHPEPSPSRRISSLQVPIPESPRARASSAGTGDRPHSPSLRSVSSSSSLNSVSSTKRPPPPPPPVGSRTHSKNLSTSTTSVSPSPSPSASPLLRPVPTPSALRAGLPPSTNGSDQELEEGLPSTLSVAALRNKFSPLIPPQSPKPVSHHVDKPPVPPRLNPPSDSENLISFTTSPEEYHSHSSSSNSISSLDDPFSEESGTEDPDSSSTAVAPPLPARKSRNQHHESSSSSRTSSESDTGSKISISGSSQVLLPPRPPPRPRPLAIPVPELEPPNSNAPPPLPVRRSTVAQAEDLAATPRARVPPPPPHSSHPSANHLVHVNSAPVIEPLMSAPPTTSDRKSFGKGNLPPPPTRTIALGDKLPPPKRVQAASSDNGESDDDDSGDEEDMKGSGVDNLPDATHASRRPPFLTERDNGGLSMRPVSCKVAVPAHTGHLAMSGAYIVVGSTHHIKIYNMNLSLEVPTLNLDTKEFGVKDGKVGAVEFKSEFLIWVGVKEGHIFEVDVRNGDLLGVKHCAHINPIIYLFRYSGSMVSIDEVGKVLIWSPDSATGEIQLLHHTPRVIRITDKLDFAQIINGVLWTAGRSEQHGAGTTLKVPIIRLYDLFQPTKTLGRSIMPNERAGPVTSAAKIPKCPGYLYIGHEEGYISIWSLDGDGGGQHPKCLEVMKVASTDVTSMEGIHDKLWVGGRNGLITVYDVAPRPWIVTNSWIAHPVLPVLKLRADPFGIASYGRLAVVSVGRDEKIGLWDGLLTLDWQDTELEKYEAEYSSFRDLKVLVVSWNCDSAKPESLHGHPANISFFHDVLNSVDSPDIIEFGFQEVIDLESRKMAAKGMLMSTTGANSNGALSLTKKMRERDRDREEGGTMLLGLSDKVSGAYKRWYDALLLAVRLAMPPDRPYTVLHTESMVGLFTCVLVKNSERGAVKDVAINTVKRGMGGRYGNKGGILSRFLIDDSSLCFVNCHLAAGQHALRARNADAAGMLEQQLIFPAAMDPLGFVGGGDGSMVLDHEIVFFHGDMNYRIDQRRDAIVSAVHANERESLLAHDQLLKEIKYNRGCRFRIFTEGPLTFPPTYKYDRRSDEYDTSEKRRAPAWCDRVLWRSRVPSRVQQLKYERYEVNVSDHRPISAAFRITVKRIRHEVRQKKKAEVQIKWTGMQEMLLKEARRFFVETKLLV